MCVLTKRDLSINNKGIFRALQVLAEHAEEHIEDTNSPLFLRFINLLINDAIFLLDEAIQVCRHPFPNSRSSGIVDVAVFAFSFTVVSFSRLSAVHDSDQGEAGGAGARRVGVARGTAAPGAGGAVPATRHARQVPSKVLSVYGSQLCVHEVLIMSSRHSETHHHDSWVCHGEVEVMLQLSRVVRYCRFRFGCGILC